MTLMTYAALGPHVGTKQSPCYSVKLRRY